jgi:hypothetical protein
MLATSLFLQSCGGPTGGLAGIPRRPAVCRQCRGAPRVPRVAVTYPSSPKSPSQCAGHRRPRQCALVASVDVPQIGLSATATVGHTAAAPGAPSIGGAGAERRSACCSRGHPLLRRLAGCLLDACARMRPPRQLPCEQTAAELVEERLEYLECLECLEYLEYLECLEGRVPRHTLVML